MTILYAFVAQDTSVVAEAIGDQSGASQLLPQTRVLLATCARDAPPAMKRVSLEGDRQFLYIREGRSTFACVVGGNGGLNTNTEQTMRHGFDFLGALQRAYAVSVAADELKSPFAAADDGAFDMDALVRLWNAPALGNPDRLVQMERGVDDAAQQLADNARALQERGDKLDQLHVANSAFFATSDNYRAYAGELQQKTRERQLRLAAAGSCVLLTLLWLLW